MFENTRDPELQREVNAELESAFNGQIVIDLGAGCDPIGFLIADRAHAKGYVGVEPHFGNRLAPKIAAMKNPSLRNIVEKSIEPECALGETLAAVVAEDMLRFLKRLPEGSVSVFCSGIDRLVIDDESYRNTVAKEIVRVLSQNGAYIGQSWGGHIEIPQDPSVQRRFVGKKDGSLPESGSIYAYRKIAKS
jgi:hypothetical protein